MKVVLFCGGLGLRMREVSVEIPKPMLRVGDHPILWHIMKYYAHYGHKEFILCLGHLGDTIKHYFLNYKEVKSNNFVLSQGGKDVQMLPNEIDDWKITFIDTGINTNIGQRLKRVQPYLANDEMFLANYSDNLTDAPLDEMVQAMQDCPNITSCFLCVRPNLSFHVITPGAGSGRQRPVQSIESISNANIWVNGGYFVFRRDIFDCLEEGREIVPDALQLLQEKGKLVAWQHDGFWYPMDTPKDMRELEALYTSGRAKWAKWERPWSRN